MPTDLDKLFADERPIESMTFAGHLPEGEERDARASQLRQTFLQAGCKIPNDIALLGDTGLYGHLLRRGANHDAAIGSAKYVRENMAGAGVGLTCFVGPDRFCLVHNIVGALQDGQTQQHAEHVEAISRPLTDKERGYVEYIESVRRITDRTGQGRIIKAIDALQGKRMPEGVVRDGDANGSTLTESGEATPLNDLALAALVAPAPEPWTCPEHGKTVWACRLCIASEIARGEFAPPLLFQSGQSHVAWAGQPIEPDALDERIEMANAAHDGAAELWVRAAKWRVKLARD